MAANIHGAAVDELEEKLAALDLRRGKRKTVSTSEYCRKNDCYDRLLEMYDSSSARRRGSIAWVLSHAVAKRRWKPDNSRLERIALLLESEHEDAMAKRGLLDVFQKYRLPLENVGAIADSCIRFLRNPQETAAVHAFSITVLFEIIASWPELYNEVSDIMPRLLNHDRPSIRVRAGRAMRAYEKQQNKR